MLRKKCINCFRTLSVKSRFDIFELLKNQKSPLSVNEITKIMHLRQPTITFHLDKLEDSGLVKKHKNGRAVKLTISQRCQNCGLFA